MRGGAFDRLGTVGESEKVCTRNVSGHSKQRHIDAVLGIVVFLEHRRKGIAGKGLTDIAIDEIIALVVTSADVAIEYHSKLTALNEAELENSIAELTTAAAKSYRSSMNALWNRFGDVWFQNKLNQLSIVLRARWLLETWYTKESERAAAVEFFDNTDETKLIIAEIFGAELAEEALKEIGQKIYDVQYRLRDAVDKEAVVREYAELFELNSVFKSPYWPKSLSDRWAE